MEGVVLALPVEGARPLDELAGLPLALRTVLTLQKEGASAVRLVVAEGDRETLARVQGDARVRVPVEAIVAASASDGVRRAASAIGAPFLLARHDVVVDPAIYRALLGGAGPGTDASAMAPDGALGVTHPAALCGPMRVTPAWAATEAAADLLEAARASGAAMAGASVTRIEAGAWALDVTTEAGRREAFRQLFEACRKPVDGIVARHLNRHVSIFISKRIVGTPVTPNMLSCITFLLSVAGAVSAAQGGWLPVMLGAFLFQWASILDGVDGELARVRFQHSKLGQWLDTVSDDASNVLFYAGLGIGARALPFGDVLMACGLASSLLHVITSAIHYQELYTLGSGDLYAIDWGFDKEPPRGAAGRLLVFFRNVVKKDFATLFFFVLSVFGVLAWFLPGIVIAQVSALVAAVARRVKRARAR